MLLIQLKVSWTVPTHNAPMGHRTPQQNLSFLLIMFAILCEFGDVCPPNECQEGPVQVLPAVLVLIGTKSEQGHGVSLLQTI